MRSLLSLLVVLCSCYSIVAPVHSQQQHQQDIETVPASATYYDKYERDVELLCRAGKPIQQCRILLPGTAEPYDIGSLPAGVSFYGAGLAEGECGVRLAKLSADRVGKFVCLLTIGGREHEAFIEYGIRVAPQPTELKISKHTNLVDGGLGVNQLLKAKCISRLGGPAAKLVWSLDGQPVAERLLKPVQITEELQNGRRLQTIFQEINMNLTSDQNGKTLTCSASHPAFTNAQRTVLPLNVKFAPEEIPHINIHEMPTSGTGMINITIHANPQPITRWTVNGRLIKEGESVDMYQAYIPHATKKAGEYRVLLKNNDLAAERASLYTLEATNLLGTQTYVIKATRVDDEGEETNKVQTEDDNSGSTFWLISVWTFFCAMIVTQ
uniref:Ig-like domain-containing protein n=1 Tax=Anopheles atroparvus TaxID=41427 RepID=A0AAG5DI82_ANOAO